MAADVEPATSLEARFRPAPIRRVDDAIRRVARLGAIDDRDDRKGHRGVVVRQGHLPLTADLGSGLLSRPIGSLVARVIRSDFRKSVDNLASLQ